MHCKAMSRGHGFAGCKKILMAAGYMEVGDMDWRRAAGPAGHIDAPTARALRYDVALHLGAARVMRVAPENKRQCAHRAINLGKNARRFDRP
jgi:hypothetical protein